MVVFDTILKVSLIETACVGKPPFRVETMETMKTPQRAGEKLEWFPFMLGLIPLIPALYRSRPSVASTRAKTVSNLLRITRWY